VCQSCRRCIKHGKFFKVHLTSWANGCWIGNVPKELACLTYTEELVIARAHTTKCWVKLNTGSASGNVCVHPHEITNLTTRLPCPLSSLYDDIVVMFVANDHAATPDIFKCTPFVIRRGRILAALKWLKENNRLYHDIEIDLAALEEYPDEENDNGCVPFPIQQQPRSGSTQGQNATYTGHGIDATKAVFASPLGESQEENTHIYNRYVYGPI
ncbi:hypothetical protein BDP27DRAFT_1222695, partial [Rhodocollybia butyracea]